MMTQMNEPLTARIEKYLRGDCYRSIEDVREISDQLLREALQALKEGEDDMRELQEFKKFFGDLPIGRKRAIERDLER